MKTNFLLVVFGLIAEMYLSNGIAEKSGVEVPQSLVLNLFPFNDSDKHYPHNSTQESSRKSPSPLVSLHNFTENINNFGFNLYRKIALQHDNNIFFSPLSLSFALAIFMLASEGETCHQISQSLNLPFLKEKDEEFLTLFQQLRLNITQNEEFTLSQNSFSFIQEEFQIKNAFHNLSKQYFDMEFLSVDFRNSTLAKKVVNEHIKKNTRGGTPTLFHDFDQHTKIILLNYILFQGKWLHPFSAKLTKLETFYIDNYRTVQVPMMFKTDKIAAIFDKTLQCYVIKLPYKGSVQMLIVMPVKEADYMFVEDDLTNELVESWLKTMKIRKMDIYFPSFKLDQTYHMDQLLQDLGIKDLFSYKADLSHLTNHKFVKISQILQRASIEVDEKGTEAAAVSVSEIMAYSLPDTIRLNRPFIFMIYEDITKNILFLGRVTNPTEL
ncbi:protein Z-dependent protease inhibitor [Protobothrops mucrosquamatus]|uniref:protein Z-dependent protease inhibitor n=1 Tax=Protobothrops mucrosquamatus TaxID=103944 RepID=UPI000775D688|nr:protein Z-dependent protease inhibitor [Protobothrops mucrosquamatus]